MFIGHRRCVQVPPVNERLRNVPGAKLLVDVVQVSAAPGAAQLRKVMNFVCGNTLVSETTQEAKSLAFDGEERCQVGPSPHPHTQNKMSADPQNLTGSNTCCPQTVSLEGTLFTRSGVISGGSSHLQTKARCWDEKDVMLLTERKDQLAAELRVSRSCVQPAGPSLMSDVSSSHSASLRGRNRS